MSRGYLAAWEVDFACALAFILPSRASGKRSSRTSFDGYNASRFIAVALCGRAANPLRVCDGRKGVPDAAETGDVPDAGQRPATADVGGHRLEYRCHPHGGAVRLRRSVGRLASDVALLSDRLPDAGHRPRDR